MLIHCDEGDILSSPHCNKEMIYFVKTQFNAVFFDEENSAWVLVHFNTNSMDAVVYKVYGTTNKSNVIKFLADYCMKRGFELILYPSKTGIVEHKVYNQINTYDVYVVQDECTIE